VSNKQLHSYECAASLSAHAGDHGVCECSVVNSSPGLPGPAGHRGDAGMTGEFGREGDSGDHGRQGDAGLPVRTTTSRLQSICAVVHFESFPLSSLLAPCRLTGILWAQRSSGSKGSERGPECGLAERCSVAPVSLSDQHLLLCMLY